MTGPYQLIRGRIAVKLTLTLVGFVAVSTIAAGLYLTRALEAFAVDALETRLVTAARLLHDDARALFLRPTPGALRDFVVRAAGPTGARVTLIATDGVVLADSEVPDSQLARLENHRDRPEVRTALAGEIGRDLRRSVSVDVPLLYMALAVRDGPRIIGVLRLALPISVVTSSYARLHRVLLAGGLLALAVAAGIGMFVAGRVTRPVLEMEAIARRMSQGEYAARAPVRSTDEIGSLGRALNAMMAALREKIDDLQEERAKATAILDGMVEGVIAVDAHECVLLMNERARAMFSVGPGRGDGKPLPEVIRNADLHEIFRATRAGAHETPLRRELRIGHPVGRMLEVTAVPLPLGAGESGAVMVLHDITALRRLERVRTEFVANVSHELRTPLTAIQGYLETLLGGALEERANARRFLEIAFRHTERLGRLLNDLMQLSDIETGRVVLKPGPLVLHDVAADVAAIFEKQAAEKRLMLVNQVPIDLRVQADWDRLTQILVNLVDNAVKYTPERGDLTLAASRGPAGFVTVWVADTGIGIPSIDLPRITERFYRVDKARSRELGGTGLGLAIVKHLVQAHGGELWLTSELGKGPTAHFSLPEA